MKLVYLAGPITGCSYDGCTNWRQGVIQDLKEKTNGIVGLSPMRGKDYLLGEKSLSASGYSDKVLSTAKGITERDRFDCTRCDVLLVNLVGSDRVSIGTMIELGWADDNRIPIVLAMEPGNIHEHAMVQSVASYIVPTLEQAVDIVKLMLIEEV